MYIYDEKLSSLTIIFPLDVSKEIFHFDVRLLLYEIIPEIHLYRGNKYFSILSFEIKLKRQILYVTRDLKGTNLYIQYNLHVSCKCETYKHFIYMRYWFFFL